MLKKLEWEKRFKQRKTEQDMWESELDNQVGEVVVS